MSMNAIEAHSDLPLRYSRSVVLCTGQGGLSAHRWCGPPRYLQKAPHPIHEQGIAIGKKYPRGPKEWSTPEKFYFFAHAKCIVVENHC